MDTEKVLDQPTEQDEAKAHLDRLSDLLAEVQSDDNLLVGWRYIMKCFYVTSAFNNLVYLQTEAYLNSVSLRAFVFLKAGREDLLLKNQSQMEKFFIYKNTYNRATFEALDQSEQDLCNEMEQLVDKLSIDHQNFVRVMMSKLMIENVYLINSDLPDSCKVDCSDLPDSLKVDCPTVETCELVLAPWERL